MGGLGRTAVPPPKIANMLDVCLARYGKARGLKTPYAKLHTIERQYLVFLCTDMVDELGKAKDTVRDFSLEFRFSCKHNDRLDDFRSQKVEQLLHRANMAIVLKDWILKLELLSEKDLRPVGLIWIRKNPTPVVFGFDDEDAKFRDENVVNLGCAIT